MKVANLGTRREFYIYQLIRLEGKTRKELEKLNTNQLQEMEIDIYRKKYNWGTTPIYNPSTLND